MGTRRDNKEGTYTKRPNGRWQYRVRIGGQRIVATGKDKADAKKAADQIIRLRGQVTSEITVKQLVEEWVEDGQKAQAGDRKAHGLRPTTFDQYRYLLGKHVVPVLGDKRVDRVEKSDITAAMRKWEGAPSTQRSTYAALVKVWDYAVKRGLVGVNVAREADRPESESAGRRDMTTQEAVALLKAATGHRWEVAVWLGLGAALRRGEILGLRWDDIDMSKGVAYIHRNVTRSSAGLQAGRPKTDRGLRYVPLGAEVLTALKAHKRKQAAERLKAGSAWTDTGHVLTTEAGGIVEPRNLSRVWASWARTAKVKDRGTHVGRHYAATQLLASGRASVADVAALLGHDPAVLLNVYAAASADGQKAAVSALGDVLSKATTGKGK